MKTIYKAFDGREFATKKECTRYEKQRRLEQKGKIIKTISGMNEHGWGELLKIYVNPFYQIVVELTESYPHEGGVLFTGIMDEFIDTFYEHYSELDSKFARRIVEEMNNYKYGHLL